MMPGLTSDELHLILEKNKEIHDEVQQHVLEYRQQLQPRGWSSIEGAKKWMKDNHYLLQAPINDESLGGFIRFQINNTHICFINTRQPRVYQNFTLFHELYHILSTNQLNQESTTHLIEADLDRDLVERSADYFASLMLMEETATINFFNSLNEDELLTKVFHTMKNFSSPYKAVLIRLYELTLISMDDLFNNFDTKHNYIKAFSLLGFDSMPVEKSLTVDFTQVEKLMASNKDMLPDIAHEDNQSVFNDVYAYFATLAGGNHAN
ncbi:ImmA/IrrE family metallo-endopeptidase [Shouchella sp. 1P09AA]|uniref:ImmA/IrrE family metallo-endopeptidase n=2 Tax=unclassified Shouchella TaxID=2893065 RepID=UPI0039A0C163